MNKDLLIGQGDKFKSPLGTTYILCLVNSTKTHAVYCFINPITGGRWTNAFKISKNKLKTSLCFPAKFCPKNIKWYRLEKLPFNS
jgi:hypothetical protein